MQIDSSTAYDDWQSMACRPMFHFPYGEGLQSLPQSLLKIPRAINYQLKVLHISNQIMTEF